MKEQIALKIQLLEKQKESLNNKVLRLNAQSQNIDTKIEHLLYEYNRLSQKSTDNAMPGSNNFSK